MSQDTQTKCNNFFKIVKSLGYPNISSYSPSNFDFLFRLQGTERFFDWFLDNVNENCLLSAQELKQFEEKAAKGQVIWDVKRLENVTSLMYANSGVVQYAGSDGQDQDEQIRNSFQATFSGSESADTAESLEKENEMLEKELELLTKNYELRKNQKRQLAEKMSALKRHKSVNEKQKYQHEKKSAEMNNQLKNLNQHLNQSIREFDINFGNDENLVNKITQSFKCAEAKAETYFEQERRLLDQIEELSSCMIDIDYLFNEKSDKSRLKMSNIYESKDVKKVESDAKEIQLIAEKYGKLMSRYMGFKMDFELSQLALNLLTQVTEKKSEFFIFSREQLEQPDGAAHRQYIEEKIVEFEKKTSMMKRESLAQNERFDRLIGAISTLKMVRLIDAEINKKLIGSSLFAERQEKMIKYLTCQRERIQFFNQIQAFKSLEYKELKELLDDLAKTKSLFISSSASNPAVETSNQSSLNVHKPNTSALSPSSSMLISGAPSSNSTMMPISSFSASMASLFASSNLHLPMNQSSSITNRPALPLSISQPSMSLKTTPSSDSDDPAFHHVLNQFLIAALTKLQSSSQLEDKFKLKKPISIDFNDNFENFFHVFNSIHSFSQTDKIIEMRSGLQSLMTAIESCMAYLYDKDDEDTSKINFNLAKINIKMPKQIREPLDRLDEQTLELQELFYHKVYKVYTDLNTQLNSNDLEKLKRNLFVHYFTQPQQLQAITNILNSL